MRCVPRACHYAYLVVHNCTSKPNTDGVTYHAPISVPTVSLVGVIGIDRRDATKDICPVMVKNLLGKGLNGLLPNLQLFLQTGKH